MKNTMMAQVQVVDFEFNGVRYTNTRPNYYYKKQDGKQVRISKAEYDEAWELSGNVELEARKAEQAKKDAETEKNFNKKANKREVKLDAEMKKLGYSRIEHKFSPFASSTCDGQSKVMLFDSIEEGIYWVNNNRPKKASKPRKSKDIAHESNGVTLTAKQVKFIQRMPEDDFYENGLDSTLWIDVYCDTITDEFNAMAVGAMVSTLREKGVIHVSVEKVNGKKCKYFGFTDLGKQVAKELGLS